MKKIVCSIGFAMFAFRTVNFPIQGFYELVGYTKLTCKISVFIIYLYHFRMIET